MDDVCLSTISQIPWQMASSAQFPAQEPLNSLILKNQSKGIRTSLFLVRLVAHVHFKGISSNIFSVKLGSLFSSWTDWAIIWKSMALSLILRYFSIIKLSGFFLKLKRLNLSTSSITALASACWGVAPFPICFLPPVTFLASLPQ